MKTRISFLIALLLLFLSACQREELPNTFSTIEPASTKEAPVSSTYEPPPSSSIVIPVPTPTTTVHAHDMKERSRRASTCTAQGEVLWQCDCGEKRTEALPLLAHTPTEATCLQGSACTVCSATLSDPLGHRLEGRRCVRCDHWIESPIFVLGQELNFDEKAESIAVKLGNPTEIIVEGDLVSLVYATNLSRLTVIQTDGDGLWGMFTMDPEAKLYFREQPITIANFSGTRDVNSDAFYQDAGSCRIFGFRDGQNGGAYYGLWMRYSECRYDYIDDFRLCQDYAGQNRLTLYYVNALRALHGLPALTWSNEAAQVAVEYSAYMLVNDFFDHDGTYGDRLRQKGIFWMNAGENISQGYYNTFFVTDAYYNSPDHRKNILSTGFSYMGTGYCRKADGSTVYGAQIFFGY